MAVRRQTSDRQAAGPLLRSEPRRLARLEPDARLPFVLRRSPPGRNRFDGSRLRPLPALRLSLRPAFPLRRDLLCDPPHRPTLARISHRRRWPDPARRQLRPGYRSPRLSQQLRLRPTRLRSQFRSDNAVDPLWRHGVALPPRSPRHLANARNRLHAGNGSRAGLLGRALCDRCDGRGNRGSHRLEAVVACGGMGERMVRIASLRAATNTRRVGFGCRRSALIPTTHSYLIGGPAIL